VQFALPGGKTEDLLRATHAPREGRARGRAGAPPRWTPPIPYGALLALATVCAEGRRCCGTVWRRHRGCLMSSCIRGALVGYLQRAGGSLPRASRWRSERGIRDRGLLAAAPGQRGAAHANPLRRAHFSGHQSIAPARRAARLGRGRFFAKVWLRRGRRRIAAEAWPRLAGSGRSSRPQAAGPTTTTDEKYDGKPRCPRVTPLHRTAHHLAGASIASAALFAAALRLVRSPAIRRGRGSRGTSSKDVFKRFGKKPY